MGQNKYEWGYSMKKWSATAFLTIILISVISAAIHNTSFLVFLKRSVPFLLLILVSFYILESSIIPVSERRIDTMANTNDPKYQNNEANEEDEFIPLDFSKYGLTLEEKKHVNK